MVRARIDPWGMFYIGYSEARELRVLTPTSGITGKECPTRIRRQGRLCQTRLNSTQANFVEVSHRVGVGVEIGRYLGREKLGFYIFIGMVKKARIFL